MTSSGHAIEAVTPVSNARTNATLLSHSIGDRHGRASRECQQHLDTPNVTAHTTHMHRRFTSCCGAAHFSRSALRASLTRVTSVALFCMCCTPMYKLHDDHDATVAVRVVHLDANRFDAKSGWC